MTTTTTTVVVAVGVDDLLDHVEWPLFEAFSRVLPSRTLRRVCRRWKATHDALVVTELEVTATPTLDPHACVRRFPRLRSLRWTVTFSSTSAVVVHNNNNNNTDTFATLKHVQLGPGAEWITDAHLHHLATWAPAVVRLVVTHAPHVTDEGVRTLLRRLTVLEELTLRYCDGITLRQTSCDAKGEEAKWSWPPRLHTLDLTGCWRVRDADRMMTPPHLRRLTCFVPRRPTAFGDGRLTALDLSCEMSAVAMSCFRAFLKSLSSTRLRELRLPNPIDNDDQASSWVSELTRFSALTCLDATSNVVRDLELQMITRTFPRLTELRADYAVGVTCDGLSRLRVLTHLTRLTLRGCLDLRDEGLECLATWCTNLTSLHVQTQNTNAFTDTGLCRLTNLRGLVEFGVYGGGAAVTDAVVTEWSSAWTRLTSLDLSCAFFVSDAIFGGLSQRRLRVLRLYGCYAVTNRGLYAYKAWANVTELDLSWCRVTDRGLRRVLSGCTSLTVLDVYGCPGVTTRGVRSALASLPQRVRVHVHAR